MGFSLRRSRRGYVRKEKALIALKVGRDGAIKVCIEAKINTPEYRAAQRVSKAVDDLADALTGYPEFFWIRLARSVELPTRDGQTARNTPEAKP